MKKKLLIIITTIFIILIISFLSLYLFAINAESRDIKKGIAENKIEANLDNVNKPLTITYIGDSLTNGFITQNAKKSAILMKDEYGYRGDVNKQLQKNGKLKESYNFAVGGYTTSDLLKQINDNRNLKETNQEIQNLFPKDNELKETYPTEISNNLTMEDAIQNSDYIIDTIGANDILNVIHLDESGNLDIDYKALWNAINEAHKNKVEIYNKIHKINPDVKILDVSIYFAFPHVGDKTMKKLYPVLILAEKKLFLNEPNNNIYLVDVKDNMQPKIKEYLPNPTDVHPTKEGYKIMANEVLKVINQTAKDN